MNPTDIITFLSQQNIHPPTSLSWKKVLASPIVQSNCNNLEHWWKNIKKVATPELSAMTFCAYSSIPEMKKEIASHSNNKRKTKKKPREQYIYKPLRTSFLYIYIGGETGIQENPKCVFHISHFCVCIEIDTRNSHPHTFVIILVMQTLLVYQGGGGGTLYTAQWCSGRVSTTMQDTYWKALCNTKAPAILLYN